MNVLVTLMTAGMLFSVPAHAFDFQSPRVTFNVDVTSYREKTFGDVIRQQYDFSCGSAAVASLASYHYGKLITEDMAFKHMFERGDKEKIKQHGFSLFDMKQYLQTQGLKAEGYKLGLEKLQELGVPSITLVNMDGYMHFVVVKGINQDSVILGDPSRGTLVMDKETFLTHYQGVVLLVLNAVDKGRETFITANDYSVYERSPVDTAINREAMLTETIASQAILAY